MSDLPTAAELPTTDAEAFTAFEAAAWDRKAANDGRLFVSSPRGDVLELPASAKLAHGTKPHVERPAEPGAQA